MPNQDAYILPSLKNGGSFLAFYHENESELVGKVGHADVREGDIIIVVIGVGRFYLFEVISPTPDFIWAYACLVGIRRSKISYQPSLFQVSLFPYLEQGMIISTFDYERGSPYIGSLPRSKKKCRHIVSQLLILPRGKAEELLRGKEDTYEEG